MSGGEKEATPRVLQESKREVGKLNKRSDLMISMDVRIARRITREEFKTRQQQQSQRMGRQKLDFLLRNRPTRNLLAQKNVFSEENNSAKRKWEQQKNRARLGEFLVNRPSVDAVGKILRAPAQDKFSTRANVLMQQMQTRPSQADLVRRGALLPSVTEESKEDVMNSMRERRNSASEIPDTITEEESKEQRALRLKTHRRSSSAKLEQFMRMQAENTASLKSQRLSQLKEREERLDNFENSKQAIAAFIGKRPEAAALVQRNLIADIGHVRYDDAKQNELEALYPSWPEGEPVLVELLEMGEDRAIVGVGAGWGHSVALDKAGGVHVFGNASEGRLGLGDDDDELTDRCEPMMVRSLNDYAEEQDDKIVAIGVGDNHTAALTGKGRVFTWGQGAWGRLGSESQDSVASPFLLSSLAHVKVKFVACGAYHTLLCAENGRDMYAFGWAKNGRLGVGGTGQRTSDIVSKPTRVPFTETKEFEGKVVQLAAGNAHSACLMDTGRVYTWGQGSYGATGHVASLVQRGATAVPRDVQEPRQLPAVERVSHIACGDKHMLVLAENGSLVLSWGDNKYGQLGRSTNQLKGGESHLSPAPVILRSGEAVTSVACGVSISGFVQGFRVVTFGRNLKRSLGHSFEADQVGEPQIVPGLTNMETLVLSYSTSMATSCDGQVFSWGDAQSGKLGFYFDDAELPEPVSSSSTPVPSS